MTATGKWFVYENHRARRAKILVVAVPGTLLVVWYLISLSFHNSVIVVNALDKNIPYVEVALSGNSLAIFSLSPGEQRKIDIPCLRHEYAIALRLAPDSREPIAGAYVFAGAARVRKKVTIDSNKHATFSGSDGIPLPKLLASLLSLY